MDDAHSRLATRLAHAGLTPHENHGVVNPPVYRASTILKPTYREWMESEQAGYRGYSYGRTGTPTSRAFETAMADLYGVDECIAVNSGLSAIVLPLLALTQSGDHMLVSDSIYYPCRRLCDRVLARYGVSVTYYDPTGDGGIAGLIRPETKLVCTESPGSITFDIQDMPALVAIAHRNGAKVMIDNTWATALHYNPFAHGVDIVVEAATKYVAGHSDAMVGAVLANAELGDRLRQAARQLSFYSGPDDLYLALRGLRTLGVRLPRHAETALTLARWCMQQPEVERVLHPALPHHPGHDIWKRDFTGSNGLFGVLFKPVPESAIEAFCDGLKYFGLGASWGGFESLVMPMLAQRARVVQRWTEPGPMLRFHAGLEDPDDLLADLDAAFGRLRAHVG